MRRLSSLSVIFTLSLSGCSLFTGPHADMTAFAPPGAPLSGPDHLYPQPYDLTYGRTGPVMPMPPGGMTDVERPPEPHSASPEESTGFSMTGGPNGNTADITPRPAIPDTEVSYGKNGGNQ